MEKIRQCCTCHNFVTSPEVYCPLCKRKIDDYDIKPEEKMTFKSLNEAKKYIKNNLPGGAYTISIKDGFAIIDETLAGQRQQEASEQNEIVSKVPYLRIGGEFN